MQFTLRDFRPADFDHLWRIDQACFPPGISYSRAELRHYIRRRTAFTLVAEKVDDGGHAVSGIEPSAEGSNGSQAVGFIVAEAAGQGRGHIITIDVVVAARRYGVGSQLLQAGEKRLTSMKCSIVELETAVDNAAALPFYKRHGYSVVGTHPRYYSNGVDALVLEKNLPKL